MYVDPNIGAVLAQGLAAILLGAAYRFRRFFSFKWLRKPRPDNDARGGGESDQQS